MPSVFPSFPHALAEPNRGLLAPSWMLGSSHASAKNRSDRPVFSCSLGANSPTAPRRGKPSAPFSGGDALTSPRKTQRGWSQGHVRRQRRFS